MQALEQEQFNQEALELHLLENWWHGCQTNMGLPTEESERTLVLLKQTKLSQSPICIIAMGCHIWHKPDWSESGNDRVIKTIDLDNPRANRFAKEFAGFQTALKSFGVTTLAAFSLSDVEAHLHMALKDMGLSIANEDTAALNIEQSVQNIAKLIAQNGGRVIPFDHFEVLTKIMGADKPPEEIRRLVTGQKKPKFQELLNQMYAFDVEHLPEYLFPQEPRKIGILWIDLISQNQYPADAATLRQAACLRAPDLVVISPFANAGDWEGEPKPQLVIPTKKEFLSQKIGLDERASKETWVESAQRVDDQRLVEALTLLGCLSEINSPPLHQAAIRLLANIVFDWDPQEFLEHPKISLSPGITLKSVVSKFTKSRREAFNLVTTGSVAVDGKVEMIPSTIIPPDSTLIRVGKRTFKIIWENHE